MLIRNYPDGRTAPRATHRGNRKYPQRHPGAAPDTTRYADRELVMHYLTRRE
jgi:hypothetical protein